VKQQLEHVEYTPLLEGEPTQIPYLLCRNREHSCESYGLSSLEVQTEPNFSRKPRKSRLSSSWY
jgi:hypothetical protein